MRGIDKVFVLNLDRRPDRLESFLARARSAGIEPVERIPAVDGGTLLPSPEIHHLFRGNDFDDRCAVMGCALTHYGVWQRIASLEWPGSGLVAVFEDDVVFCRDFLRLWDEELSPRLPPGCDLIYLGGIRCPRNPGERGVDWPEESGPVPALDVEPWCYVAKEINSAFVRPRRGGFCAYSYLIAPRAARTFCDIVAHHGIHRAIDWFMIDFWHCVQVCASTPLLCWSSGGDTDIQRSRS